MILSYRAHQYSNLDTLNSKICPLYQILEIDEKKREEEEQEKEEDPIIIEEDIWMAVNFLYEIHWTASIVNSKLI